MSVEAPDETQSTDPVGATPRLLSGDTSRPSPQREPVVHVGYHKTGSTWFQTEFYPFLENASYVDRDTVKDAFLNTRGLQFSAEQAHSVLPDPDVSRPVLCDEVLSGGIQSGGLHGMLTKEVADRIRTVWPSASIVVFLRNQLHMIASTYKQYVLRGGNRSIKHFISPSYPPFNYPFFSPDHFLYDRFLDYYGSLFGTDQVYVCLFEEFRSDTSAFLDRFCRRLNLSVDRARVDTGKKNRSDQRVIHYVRKTLNHFSAEAVPHKHYFFSIPGFFTLYRRGLNFLNRYDLFGGRLGYRRLLSAGTIERLKSHYAPSNRRVMERYGLELKEHGYPL